MPLDNAKAKVDVVFYRYGSVYVEEHDSVQAALRFIELGEDDGQMATVGVFLDGEPHIWGGYVRRDPPTPEQAVQMRNAYTKAQAVDE